MIQLENIIQSAANLIVKGEATADNAIQMAIELENNRCIKMIEDIDNMKRGYVNDLEKNQKAFKIILNSVYNKLNNKTVNYEN